MKNELLVIAIAAILFSGCATIVSNESDIAVTSDPDHIKCNIMDENEIVVRTGTTPFKAKLSNLHEDYNIKCDNGMQSEVGQTFNPWYFGNIVFGGIVGAILDPISGAITRNQDTHLVLKSAENGYVE